tara:strand:- start:556 stop:1656 length:1101 start_codon:yes stop_codon:yes gene_type:complete
MGSKTATQARNAQRQADTAELMEAIRTGGEISKKREAELAAAADRGRGIKFIEGSPTVKGLTQIDPVTGEKKPVFRTGATAEDYTGRIVSSAPTFGELFGDASRALVGGTADKQVFTLPTSRPGTPTMDFANMVPDPRPTQGMIPSLINTGGLGGLALNIIQDLYGKGKNFFFPEEEEEDTFSSAADAIGGAATMGLGDIRTQKNLADTTADEIDQFIRTIGQPNVDSFSSGADATRPAVANLNDRFSSAADAMGGAGIDLEKPEQVNQILNETTDQGVYQTGPNLLGVGPEMGVFNVPGDRDSGFTPALQAYYNNLIEQGVSPGEALRQTNILSSYGYKEGGLTDTVPPEEGPMSAGVASLFKNK